ncbi:hypothetical protein [Pseudomonas sp. H9]|uniref:hypothetical protein n=1 Tax=Pseudomonas sp. H9 TaxID=483968 RepID=UPI001057AA09|nr:hypothetical protein [Pseudomonas sp. H9]TDF86370.1 hypothetical protein E1573_02040 [Pseudomonas sp. H9]
MFFRRVLSSITLLIGLEAYALPTTDLSPEQRHALGKQLAEQAGASQWQQLWQRSRQAGHLQEHPTTAYFSLPSAELIKAAALTLSQPADTQALKQTQVLYRRDFSPHIVGKQAQENLSALCIWVDWRTLPENALSRPSAYLGQISLLLARPCR